MESPWPSLPHIQTDSPKVTSHSSLGFVVKLDWDHHRTGLVEKPGLCHWVVIALRVVHGISCSALRRSIWICIDQIFKRLCWCVCLYMYKAESMPGSFHRWHWAKQNKWFKSGWVFLFSQPVDRGDRHSSRSDCQPLQFLASGRPYDFLQAAM